MESTGLAKEYMFEAIRTQIETNKPPETKITYERLRKEGYSESETMDMIFNCLSVEIFDILKSKSTFDEERYVQRLKNLPEEPF